MAERRTKTADRVPHLPPVRLGQLTEGTADQFAGDEDLDGFSFAGLRFEELVWTGRRRLGSSRVDGATARSWRAPGALFSGSVLTGLDVLTLTADGSGWRQVELLESRVGSLELFGSTLRSVHFIGCRIGYANLRDTHLTDVAFTDCVIDDLDLMRATATRVALTGTRLRRLELTGAKLADFDLRGAQLAEVSGIEGLRGAIISTEQLVDLAPILAARLGIIVP